MGPASSLCEYVDGIPGGILEQEPVLVILAQRLEIAEHLGVIAPSTSLGQCALVRLCDGEVVQAVERHGGRAGPAECCSREGGESSSLRCRAAAVSGKAAVMLRARSVKSSWYRRQCVGVNELERATGQSEPRRVKQENYGPLALV